MAKTSNASVKRRRDKLRAMGLRPIQIWVPDTRAPGFTAEIARQCRLINDFEKDDPDGSIEWLEENNRQLADGLDREGL